MLARNTAENKEKIVSISECSRDCGLWASKG